jgi:hypothetical protein
VVEGQAGFDTLDFNGNGANEIFDVSANGERVRFTRNVGNITMDLNDVEKVSIDALGGTDTITVSDLSGTDVTEVSINLAGTLSGTASDGQVDNVLTNATNGNDTIGIVGAGTSLTVVGLPALASVTNAEGGLDGLTVQGLAGDDSIRRRPSRQAS